MANIIRVKVISNAKRNEVKKGYKKFKVYLTAPPVDGKANRLLIKVLARYFDCKKSKLRIIKGEKARDKLIEKKTSREIK